MKKSQDKNISATKRVIYRQKMSHKEFDHSEYLCDNITYQYCCHSARAVAACEDSLGV